MNGTTGSIPDFSLLLSESCPVFLHIVRYDGNSTSSKPVEDLTLSGSVTHQLDGVRNWIQSLGRRFPTKLLYELIANAVIHRDYSLTGETIVRIFSSKVQIVSLGGSISGLTAEDIKTGISMPRNGELARELCSRGYCSLTGTGMTMLAEYCSDSDTASTINITDNVFFIEVPFTVRGVQKLKSVVSRKRKTARLDQENAIIEYIRQNGSIKRSTVQKLLKVGQTRSLNILSAMTESGAITQSGYGKKTVYLLTDTSNQD